MAAPLTRQRHLTQALMAAQHERVEAGNGK